MQGFAGYPLTAIMLQREGKRCLPATAAANTDR
jgi:hypothetical protein